MALLLSNIKKLLTMDATDKKNSLGVIEDAAIIVDKDKIVWLGQEKSLPYVVANKHDCLGGVVLPGLVDCHTHLVFAGSREEEFAMRARGDTYLEIMEAGGGILSTMQETRWASKEKLIELALPRLARMLSYGVTSVEIKSGYGLNSPDELKMLEVMGNLADLQPIEINPTFLAAHAIPPEYENKADDYVEHIINDMLPQVAAQKIAKFCDVFVEKGAFTKEQGLKILNAAKKVGLQARVHAEQLSESGGAELAAAVAALSASHLEYASAKDLEGLAQHNVVAEILPIAQEFLGMTQMISGKTLRNSDVKIAIATDFNPGSAMCDNLQLAARLAVTRCGLTCEEAFLGLTKYAAQALDSKDIGVLAAGKKADICVLSTSSPWEFFYNWSINPVASVFKNGKKVYEKDNGSLASSPPNL